MGDFRTGQTWTIGPAPVALGIDLQDWFVNLDPGRMGRLGFSPRVVRVFLTGGSVCFHGVEGDVRPPTPAELPSARYLAYGTSITQGASASMRHLAFVAQTSWRLRADAINLGVGSSCACEPAIADYVASRGDWRVATLEHAANMFHWPLNEFRERSADFIERVASGRPDGLLACISAWPKADDMGPEHVSPRSGGSPEQYRAALRDVVARCGRPNVVVIEGPHLLPEMRGLAMDLLHPTDYGHTLIAENLAREFRRLLPAVFA
jgi:hypothetical protein